MDTEALAKLVPVLMAEHPGHSWTLISDGAAGSELHFEVRPLADPTRVANVVVSAGAEVYRATFADHTAVDFAYEDADRREALQDRIDLAAEATTGPTRVTLELDGKTLIGSTLVISPDGPTPRTDGPISWPLRRLKARIRRRHVAVRVLDFPALPND